MEIGNHTNTKRRRRSYYLASRLGKNKFLNQSLKTLVSKIHKLIQNSVFIVYNYVINTKYLVTTLLITNLCQEPDS